MIADEDRMNPVFPKLNPAFRQERQGVLAVAAALNRLNLIWREMPHPDTGIDGHIEYVDENGAITGAFAAAQVKSGISYFKGKTEDAIPFLPDPKHCGYWARFPVPVILILHDPESNACYFADARSALRGMRERSPILIPRSSILSGENRSKLFEAYGPIQPPLQVDEAMSIMMQRRIGKDQSAISYFQLFLAGLTDIGAKLYFGMDLFQDLMEARCPLALGAAEYLFLDDYVNFLAAQRLAYVDFADYIVDRDERALVPVNIWTLTERGRALVRFASGACRAFCRIPGYQAAFQESAVRIENRAKIELLFALEEEILGSVRKEPSSFQREPIR